MTLTSNNQPNSNVVDGSSSASDVEGREDVGKYNILKNRLILGLMRSRLYPGILQWMVLGVFIIVGWQLLLGPSSAHKNLGTALMWVLWWPIIPIVFLFLGRFWCAICPFALINDLVQKFVGVERPVPEWLKKYGIWIIDGLFLLITWSDHVFGIVESPWGSGILLLLLTSSVIISGAFLQRRAFCRYLCFLGGLSANYARTGMVALRATPSVCATCKSRAVCFNGSAAAPGCPLFQFPRTMDSNANCNLCAACVKNCPNGSIQITVRPPTKELWFIRKPKLEESFLATAIMGIVLIQNITMLSVWTDILSSIESVTGITSYPFVFTIAFAVSIGTTVAFLSLASWIAGRFNQQSLWKNFARFGYAIIPLDIAGHIAHNLFHLLAEGKVAIYTAMSFFNKDIPAESTAILSNNSIQILQWVLIILGASASLYAALRLARSDALTASNVRIKSLTFTPFAGLIIGLTALNIYLFSLPMAMRM